jgi:hypothetical protein
VRCQRNDSPASGCPEADIWVQWKRTKAGQYADRKGVIPKGATLAKKEHIKGRTKEKNWQRAKDERVAKRDRSGRPGAEEGIAMRRRIQRSNRRHQHSDQEQHSECCCPYHQQLPH